MKKMHIKLPEGYYDWPEEKQLSWCLQQAHRIKHEHMPKAERLNLVPNEDESRHHDVQIEDDWGPTVGD